MASADLINIATNIGFFWVIEVLVTLCGILPIIFRHILCDICYNTRNATANINMIVRKKVHAR